MSECSRDLKKGLTVILFYYYQVEHIKEKFKDKVNITYNEANEWWEAKLND